MTDDIVLYKYRAAGIGLDVLASGTLRWSHPRTFQDAEDSRWDPFWNAKTGGAREALVRMLGDFVLSVRPIDDVLPQHRAAIKRLRFHLHRHRDVSRMRKQCEAMQLFYAWTAILPAVDKMWTELGRILCLCRDGDSAAMWESYAKGGTGIAIGFRPSFLAEDPCIKDWVTYVDSAGYPQVFGDEELTRLSLFTHRPEDASLMGVIALTKARRWAYEREYRIVRLGRFGSLDDRVDWPFPADAVTEVVLGPQTSDEDTRRVHEIVATRYPRATIRRHSPDSVPPATANADA